MIDVFVTTDAIEPAGFLRAAARLQNRFRFIPRPQPPPPNAASESGGCPIHLYITDAPFRGLFFARYEKGVAVSTSQSEGICLYAGIEVDTYLVLCSLLGLTQWRALDLNPLLRIDDFIHEADINCLFTKRELKQDYALLLEDPALCPGCHEFYRYLGTDRELLAVQHIIDFIRTGLVHDVFPGKRPSRKPETVR